MIWLGWNCPTCNLYMPQTRVLNADLQPASKPADGVIIELACGHTLGVKELSSYREAILAIDADHASKIAALRAERADAVNQAWNKLKTQLGGGAV